MAVDKLQQIQFIYSQAFILNYFQLFSIIWFMQRRTIMLIIILLNALYDQYIVYQKKDRFASIPYVKSKSVFYTFSREKIYKKILNIPKINKHLK